MMTEQKITGYRDLPEEVVEAVNTGKRWEDELGDFILALRNSDIDVDPKFMAVAVTHFQQGFMALTRALTRPESRLK